VSDEAAMIDTPEATDFADLWSTDRKLQNKAFAHVLALTERPVDWAYDVWDELLAMLTHKDNHNRAIAAQVLCSLAKSDPQGRMLADLDALVAVTRDDRFVTARHTLLALWKVGVAGDAQREALVSALEGRFGECAAERNCTLIRYDIEVVLRRLYDAVGEESVRAAALQLIESEGDAKYRKKYLGVWKQASPSR
jgi:hypothetical protein